MLIYLLSPEIPFYLPKRTKLFWESVAEGRRVPSAVAAESACGAGVHKTRVWSLGQEEPREEEMATSSRILAWKIPRTEPGGRPSKGLQRAGHNWAAQERTAEGHTLYSSASARFRLWGFDGLRHNCSTRFCFCLFLFCFFASHRGLWDFSSWTRDWTQAVANHWLTGNPLFNCILRRVWGHHNQDVNSECGCFQ